MLSKWPIREKLLVGLGLLVVLVGTLSYTSFHGVYAYRGLIKHLAERAGELPVAMQLAQQTGDLRVALETVRAADRPSTPVEQRFAVAEFNLARNSVKRTLDTYRTTLLTPDHYSGPMGDGASERKTLAEIEASLARIDRLCPGEDWRFDAATFPELCDELEHLQDLSAALPGHLHFHLANMVNDVRTQYRTLIGLVWVTSLAAAGLLGLLVQLFYRWVFRPLRVLIKGSRRVAAGNFEYRLRLDTSDEMAELADSMNNMTERFCTIRDSLDRQVQERTKQVVRSERLASVGFLAAGVAHEINNPLASIAMCAESLEGRLAEVQLGDEGQERVVRQYLRMIQKEAFRCKEITEKLLDFSRMGDLKKHPTDLRQIAQDVIEMIAHLGKYQGKQVVLAPGGPLVAAVNPQELKQVVLNLVTNGLDSLDAGGCVWIDLTREGDQATLTFTDNGCGMTPEVLEHLFEPFFTRRRGGQGTGLGLSITYRIVADHSGQLDAFSAGVGQGSQFRVSLPLEPSKEESHQYQAA